MIQPSDLMRKPEQAILQSCNRHTSQYVDALSFIETFNHGSNHFVDFTDEGLSG